MTPADRLLQDPRYLPYLPLLYVAWADGELAPAEVAHMRRLASVELAPGLDEEPVLATWLDPERPPSATALLRVLRRVGEVAGRVPPEGRRGLADLGLGLAQAEDVVSSDAVARAVGELERALELDGSDVVRGLLADAGVAWPVPAQGEAVAVEAIEVDRGALVRALDGRLHAVRNQVRDLLDHGDFHRPSEPTRSEYRAQVGVWLQTLSAAGLGKMAFPQADGVTGDLGSFIAAFETLADFDLSLVIKAGVQFGLFGGSIYFLGSERHHALLGDVASGRLLGCYAMTERGHGSNVRQLGTTATYDPVTDEIVVHTPDRESWKDYIGNAARDGRMATVFAQLQVGGDGHGVHAVLVPIRDAEGAVLPGVHIEDCGRKIGLDGVDNGRIAFDQVRVPRANLLDRYGRIDENGAYQSPIASATKRFFTMLGTLVAGRISVAAAGVAAARNALLIAVRYGQQRRQFGPAGSPEHRLLDYPAHQERLMPALAEAVVLTLALRSLADRYVATTERARQGAPEGQDGDSRELEALAAGLKALGTWHATATIQACRECCGGAGYMWENRFGALKADTDVFTTFEGDNTVLLQLAARGVLTAFSASLGDRWTGVVRHLADRAAAGLAELDLLTPRRTDAAHLRDATWHDEILGGRVQKLTWSVAGRLRSRIKGGMDPFLATVECQDHLMDLGRTWSEHAALRAAHDAVAAADDDGVRAVFSLCARLYALDRLWQDQAWYLRHGLIEADKARAIRRERRVAMAELRAIATTVVGAFGVPERLVEARIGQV